VSVASASETLAELRSRPYQGVVLDLDVPEMDGIALLQDMRQDPALAEIAVVAFTGRDLDRKEKNRFGQLGAIVIAAGEGESALNRMAAGVKQFLQGLKGEKPQKAQEEPTELPALSNGLLAGKKALLVDDDIRNLFALTAVLESNGIVVVSAESGKDAITRLHDTPGIDIVLMDIMMPHMDGYDTMRRIRSEPQFKDLPIIALSAKAMKGNREKCRLRRGPQDCATGHPSPPGALGLAASDSFCRDRPALTCATSLSLARKLTQ
jgi:CheY-like chemotaxis protein